MAVTNFPNPRGIRILDSNEQVQLGSFVPDRNFELQYIRALILKIGTAGGSETIQCNVTTQLTDLTINHAQSNTVNLSDWTSDTNFYGWCRFDFNLENFITTSTYYINLKFSNYTNNQDTYYLACVYDSPESTNSTKGDSPHHILEHVRAFEIYSEHYEY